MPRPQGAHARALARNTQHLRRSERGGERGEGGSLRERVLRGGGRDAQSASRSVGRFLSLLPSSVGFVTVAIVGADKAGQIERGEGELQKRREAMRGHGWHPSSDRAGIVIRQPEYVHRGLRFVCK